MVAWIGYIQEVWNRSTMEEYKLLIINPGSTSTKISLYINEKEIFEKSRFHDAPVLLQYPHVNDQVPFRYDVILEMLAEEEST